MNIEPIRSTCVIVIKANSIICYAHPLENKSAKAFIDKLNTTKLILDMYDNKNSQITGTLPFDLPSDAKLIETKPGDIVFYNGSISICYDKSNIIATPLARIGNTSKEKLLSVFESGNVSVIFNLEWSE